MKNVCMGILLFICLSAVNAQDKIILKNGKELIVYVIEKSDTEIKYKLADTANSNITFRTNLNNVKTIQYQNGTVDLLSSLNIRSKYPLGITGGISLIASEEEGGMFTAGVDYAFTPKLSGEINFGTGGEYGVYYSVGGKYWLADKYGKSGFSPFTGLLYGGQYGVNFWEVPLGISYIAKFGFQTSFHLSYLRFGNHTSWLGESSRLNAELRIGWRFK